MAVIQRYRPYRNVQRPAGFSQARQIQQQIAFILSRYDHGAIPLTVHNVVEDLRRRLDQQLSPKVAPIKNDLDETAPP